MHIVPRKHFFKIFEKIINEMCSSTGLYHHLPHHIKPALKRFYSVRKQRVHFGKVHNLCQEGKIKRKFVVSSSKICSYSIKIISVA